MDLEQKRVEDDLRGVIEGDVGCDDLFAQMYSTDASIYQLRPFGVVRPRTVEDCAAVVREGLEAGWLANRWDVASSSISRVTCDVIGSRPIIS
jgi:hypothetical protein